MAACRFAKDYVRKRVAHNDVATHPEIAARSGATLVSAGSRHDVEEALRHVRAAMNAASVINSGAGQDYTLTDGPQDADALMQCLKKGVDAQERKRRVLESGEATVEDYLPERWV